MEETIQIPYHTCIVCVYIAMLFFFVFFVNQNEDDHHPEHPRVHQSCMSICMALYTVGWIGLLYSLIFVHQVL